MEFRFIPVPVEDYEALGITEDSIIQTYLTDDGALIVRPVLSDDLENFQCDSDCENCPVSGTDCDGDCFGCPCCGICDDSDLRPEGVCKSHGDRRENVKGD